MFKEIENPFSVTKAIEFTDSEIFEYWIDFFEENSGEFLLNPSEISAKFIIGSRGCGKTHLLRYFSFQSQLIKYKGNVDDYLYIEKYIGIYNTFGVLNSANFRGSYLTSEQWLQLFKIYFEYYLVELLLLDILKIIQCKSLNISELFFENLKNIFFNRKDVNFKDFQSLTNFISKERCKIDKEIIDAAFFRKINYAEIETNIIPGAFLNQIVNAVTSEIDILKNIKFIFILDEYDKLFEWQKEYINTLVWDKKGPVTYWIGARTYGYTTRKTLTPNTVLKPGSDFHEIMLDDFFRNDEKKYKIFATKLIEKRITKYNKERKNLASNTYFDFFKNKFSVYNENTIISSLKQKGKIELNHFDELRKNIITYNEELSNLKTKDSNSNCDEIICNLKFHSDENPLHQKYCTFYFYKLWFQNSQKKIDLLSFSKIVKDDFHNFKTGKKSYVKTIESKWKKDLLSQLSLENNLKNYEYSGLENFIELSSGNIRTLILLLKNTIENSNARGEKPLQDDGLISLDSQYLSAYRVAEWYYNDAEIFGDDLKIFYSSIRKLTDYLKLYRTSNNLPEKSVLSFYFREKETSVDVLEVIKKLDLYSILIKAEKNRKEKNGIGLEETKYYLNPILSPLWNLPINEGGTPLFTQEVMNIIFSTNSNDLVYNKFYNDRKNELNAPFRTKNLNLTIFDINNE